jgi:hypothetical protein
MPNPQTLNPFQDYHSPRKLLLPAALTVLSCLHRQFRIPHLGSLVRNFSSPNAHLFIHRKENYWGLGQGCKVGLMLSTCLCQICCTRTSIVMW